MVKKSHTSHNSRRERVDEYVCDLIAVGPEDISHGARAAMSIIGLCSRVSIRLIITTLARLLRDIAQQIQEGES